MVIQQANSGFVADKQIYDIRMVRIWIEFKRKKNKKVEFKLYFSIIFYYYNIIWIMENRTKPVEN